jgi:uncharacterized protein
MPISLHAAFVPSALQMLGAAAHLVDKAESWCAESGCAPAEVIEARIHPEMFPFAYQVKSVAVHTAGALEGVRAGLFTPDIAPPPESFADLRARIAEACAALEGMTDAEMEGFVGRPVRFEFRAYRMDFTAEDFLLSFSQPNFYFHASTAYAILRMKGVPVGKRDFLGRMRLAQPQAPGLGAD